MSAFDHTLTAFQQARLDVPELLTAVEQLPAQTSGEIDKARQRVEMEYGNGRLSEAVYTALLAALQVKALAAADQPTVVELPPSVKPGVLDEETRIVAGGAAASTDQVSTKPPTLTTESLLKGLDAGQAAVDLVVGDTVKSRFVLEGLLGIGGMGMVFKARDLRKVEAADKEPFVALKVLNRDFQYNPLALVALQRETKRTQVLAHPNIIKVYDFDRDGSHVFMTMEYLVGTPLSQFIKEHAPNGLPFQKAWPIVRAMAEALAYAHKKNIVHSDLKPGNVFICSDGEIRVLDFGIACAIGRSEKAGEDATVFDARSLGALTVAYASLEQLNNCDPDPRDDIYALACITYELLVGKHPFGRLSAEKAMEVNLTPKAVNKLSRRQWKALQKALAFTQEKRCASVNEFLKAMAPRSPAYYGLWGGVLAIAILFGVNVYWRLTNLAGDQRPIETAMELSVDQQQKIKDLLELAAIHFDVGYLTAPTGSNAFWAYQEILNIDPYNSAAIEGIAKIADTLMQQARELQENGDRSAAIKKVAEGLDASPLHKGLLALREKYGQK